MRVIVTRSACHVRSSSSRYHSCLCAFVDVFSLCDSKSVLLLVAMFGCRDALERAEGIEGWETADR